MLKNNWRPSGHRPEISSRSDARDGPRSPRRCHRAATAAAVPPLDGMRAMPSRYHRPCAPLPHTRMPCCCCGVLCHHGVESNHKHLGNPCCCFCACCCCCRLCRRIHLRFRTTASARIHTCPPRQVFLCSFANKLNTIISMLSDSHVPSVRVRSLIACVQRACRGPSARSHRHAQLTCAWWPAQAPGRCHRRTHALGQGGAWWLRVLALFACVFEATGLQGYLGGQHANTFSFAALKADGSITA